ARGDRKPAPALVPRQHLAVLLVKHRRLDRGADHLVHFSGGRPNVAQIDGLPVLARAERFRLEIEIDPPRERVRHDQRWGREVVRSEERRVGKGWGWRGGLEAW